MRPNLLLITTDQHRGDCLSCEGHHALETPHLDALAERGYRFTHAYSAVPSSTPARAAILTGMDQWNHGRLTMTGTDALEFPQTLPGGLAAAGYQTQAVGKMHFFPPRRLHGFHHLVLDEEGHAPEGFECDYLAWFNRNKDGDYTPRSHGMDQHSWVARPSHLPEHLHPTYWTASEGIRFLKNRDASKPFFLWLSFSRPHSPYDPPKTYFDMYAGADIPKPPVGDWAKDFEQRIADVNAPFSRRPWTQTRRALAAYYGSVTFVDHQIGRLLGEINQLDPKLLANTLVVFTADHGDMLGDHHHWRKTHAYEGSARVPFIVRPPEGWNLAGNQTIDRPVELRDVLPTFWEAAGVKVPSTVDGASVLPLLRDPRGTWREMIQGEHTVSYLNDFGMQYLTDGRRKYVWFHHTGYERFFDLTADPQELRDLGNEPGARARVIEWRKWLADINERRGDPRGKRGELVVQQRALALSPNYAKWRDAARAADFRNEK